MLKKHASKKYLSETPLKSHQSTASAAYRHGAIITDGLPEFRRLLVIPHIDNLVRFDVTDDVVVVIAAEANVAVTINLHCHKDADALVITKGFLMVGVITLDFTFCI